jgi:G:T/U-mismatch repair DNA glycosylase
MALINGLKEYRSARGNGEVMLIANPHSKEVVDICEPKNYRRLTNETLFDVTSRILNDNPNLSIETIDMNPRRGGVAINLLNAEEVGFPGAGKDEFFKFGFSIVQRSKDTIIETYNQRLVCSNGLRVSLGQGAIGGNRDITFEDKFRLEGTSADDVRTFLNKLESMKKAGFVPPTFQATLDRAVTTKASFLEVQNAMISAQQLIREDMPDIKKSYVDSIARNYFHAHGDTSARIFKSGFNPLTMNDKQKSFIKTGMSVWDVVNSLTFLGSNNSGIPMSEQHQLKAEAGNLFGKGTSDGYDLQFSQFASI